MVTSRPQKEKGAQHFHFSVYLSGLVQHLYLTLKIIASNQSLNVFSHSSGSRDETVKGTERERERTTSMCVSVCLCVCASVTVGLRGCVLLVGLQIRAEQIVL